MKTTCISEWYNNPEDAKVLNTFCEPIAINDYRDILDIKQHIRDMIQICNDTKAVWIASNQIGITKRFFYMNTPDNQQTYINPALIKWVWNIQSIEWCLSFRDQK